MNENRNARTVIRLTDLLGLLFSNFTQRAIRCWQIVIHHRNWLKAA